MSNEVKRFFKSIDFNINEFNNAEVEKVYLNQSTDSFKVHLNVDEVVNKDMVDKLKDCSQNGIDGKFCEVVINYKNINLEDIKQYVDIYIDKLVKNKPSLCILKEYKIELNDKELIIVINMNLLKNDLKLIEKNIKKYLKNYHLGNYNVIIKEVVVQKELKETINSNNNIDYKLEESNHVFGQLKEANITKISNIYGETRNVLIEAYVFNIDKREAKGKKATAYILNLMISDKSDSYLSKLVLFQEEIFNNVVNKIKLNSWYKFFGNVVFDSYLKELVLEIKGIEKSDYKDEFIADNAKEKRIELHAHTMMSAMDSVIDPEGLLKHVSNLGHKAVAITDHNVTQAFPTLFNSNKWKYNDLKVIYGIEMNVVDTDNKLIYNFQNHNFVDQEFIAFDVETTGLNSGKDSLIEIGAVKFKNGEIIDSFSELISYDGKLPEIIIKITNITDEMLKGKDSEENVLRRFIDFIKDAPLVAHNAGFDKSFIDEAYKKYNLGEFKNTIIDTMSLSRVLYPEWRNHRLTTLVTNLDVPWDEEKHHRADYDSEGTALAFHKMISSLERENITDLKSLNNMVNYDDLIKFAYPFHISILVKNNKGLKNLFKIVSIANTKYLFKGSDPKIPRDELSLLKDGLLFGSGCVNGEIFAEGINKDDNELREMMAFYDYIEVYPTNVVTHLIGHDKLFKSVLEYQGYVKRLINVAKMADKIVVATGDVHNLTKDDLIYRKIIINQKTLGKLHPLNRKNIEIPNQYFLTTEEMLEDFSYLSEDLRSEIVVKNTNLIADMIEQVEVIKKDLYTPKMDNSDSIVKNMVFENAKNMYGEKLPKLIEERLNQELEGIIGGGYDVVYLISEKLVKKSNDDGYFVGSRGSVGSSLVATMMHITEVNPLPPHYVCSKCRSSLFNDDEGPLNEKYLSGFDMPDKTCSCGEIYKKNGHDLPFATFLGFKAEKVPDIDLNFSGDYQSKAHEYVKELFGDKNAYRAGTISTVAAKTAFGYVRGYAEDKGLAINRYETERLSKGIIGVKRSTGQHPGGIIVIPKEKDVFDFSPFQYPADEPGSSWYTTHFDFHAIEDNVLKLDILGHDDPTMLKYLEDTSGVSADVITFDDELVMSLFRTCEAIGLKEEDIMCETGTLGVPEFGTNFVVRMLQEVKPTKFADLVKISGLSHGTNVWQNNVREIILDEIATFDDVVGCRDDIMTTLIGYGLEPAEAFNISEFVRKGRPKKEPEKWIPMDDLMREHNVPSWFIEMLRKIEYMFPKAHATAYVMMAYRVAWFKVYHPLNYYSAYFSIRRSDFDVPAMLKGEEAIRRKIVEIKEKGWGRTQKEEALSDTLNVALEMIKRGYTFENVSVDKSLAKTFIINEADKSLTIPFMAIEGLGESVANNIILEREKKPFYSIEDFQNRGKVNKTTMETLELLGVFDGMPESSQMSLF